MKIRFDVPGLTSSTPDRWAIRSAGQATSSQARPAACAIDRPAGQELSRTDRARKSPLRARERPCLVMDNQDLEIILLGTGTSGQLPNVSCLTNHLDPNPRPACRTCLSTTTAEGKNNIRRNTSAVVRGKRPDGSKSLILIDCGKSFLSSALEFFPKFGLRKIDAVLLTHAHADAINGLDDLRGWTLKGVIQPFVKVYVSAHTLSEIARSWPYMVESSKATGGGDVPAFEWIVIDENRDFFVEGIRVTPLNVHHGRFFDPPPAAPTNSSPNLPTCSDSLSDAIAPPPGPAPIRPFFCLGFIFHPSIVYLSDVSYIPESEWSKLLLTPLSLDALTSSASTNAPMFSPAPMDQLTPPASPPATPLGMSASDSPAWPVLFLDCLFLQEHPSHFGILHALTTILRLQPTRTYLMGFSHALSHEEWTALGQDLDGTREQGKEEAIVQTAKSLAGEVWEEAKKRAVSVRPAFDGLRIECEVDAKGGIHVRELD
ncbi:Beta-lactamase-like [Phaffia rhodozyma]|uniref:Beta-lactamase-like n=1 Tax=Phaffia rhodozyma TaxID=264483 RepID=A0A0F7SMT3_PHARH|nr:Beta-lactamase-like [Phaffia rhodozyma]